MSEFDSWVTNTVPLTDASKTVGATSPASDWFVARRIAFRFFFSYLALYLILYRFVSDLNFEMDFGFAPGAKPFLAAYAKTWAPLVIWTGKHILGVSGRLSFRPSGNSDGIFSHVQLFCVRRSRGCCLDNL